MAGWYNKVSANLSNIVDAIDDTAKNTVQSVNDAIPEVPDSLKMDTKKGGRRKK